MTNLDACPECPPGIPDAAPAIGKPIHVPGGTVTDHQCGTSERRGARSGGPGGRLTG